MGGIFISYRREDASHAAGRLVDRLGRTFKPEQLFIDIDNIEPGLDFVKELSKKVEACDVLLAVIGPGWLASQDVTGARRLDSSKDFVRIELETALARDVRVIPVLVDGAQMPKEEELPPTLQPLVNRHAVRLAHERFASDAEDLTRALTKILTPVEPGLLSGGKRPPLQTAKKPPSGLESTQSQSQGLGGLGPKATAFAFVGASLAASIGGQVLFSNTGWTWLDPALGKVGAEVTGLIVTTIGVTCAALFLAMRRGAQLTGLEAALYWLPPAALASLTFVPLLCIANGDSTNPYNRDMIGTGFTWGAVFFVVSGL